MGAATALDNASISAVRAGSMFRPAIDASQAIAISPQYLGRYPRTATMRLHRRGVDGAMMPST